jgi:hypothetical protein
MPPVGVISGACGDAETARGSHFGDDDVAKVAQLALTGLAQQRRDPAAGSTESFIATFGMRLATTTAALEERCDPAGQARSSTTS